MRFDKITVVIASVSLTLALCIIAITPPATGYEISIYDAYPWYFWLFICGSISCGVVSLVRHSFSPGGKSNWWMASFYIVVLANVIVILLPVFRGYFLGSGGDTVTHLGHIKDVTLTGSFGNENIYPLSHILATSVHYITGLDFVTVAKIPPPLFYVLYMMGLYLLARALGGKSERALLVIAFGAVPLFLSYGIVFLPTHFFLLLLPLILMLPQKMVASQYGVEYALILVIMLIPLPFFHPLESLFFIGILLTYGVSIVICRFLERYPTSISHGQSTTNPYPLGVILRSALIVFIVFLLWFSQFELFRRGVTTLYELFVYGYGGMSPMQGLLGEIITANFTTLDFIDLLIKNYGHQLLFISLSIVAMLIISRKVFRPRTTPNVEEVFFSLTFWIFAFLYLGILAGIFIGTGRSPRIFTHSLFAATVLNGIVFHESVVQLGGKKFKILVSLLITIIIFSVIIGVFSVYSSPHIRSANTQVTRMQWSGLEWFFDHKTSSSTIYLEEITERAPAAIFGLEALEPESVGAFYISEQHFGYDDTETLARAFSAHVYIVISERNRSIYTILWPDVGRYTLDDFDRLNFDPALSKVYHNGDLEIWRVFHSR